MKNLNILDLYPKDLPNAYKYTRIDWTHNYVFDIDFLKAKTPNINGWVPQSRDQDLLKDCGFDMSNIYDKLFFQGNMIIIENEFANTSSHKQTEKIIIVPHFLKNVSHIIRYVYDKAGYEHGYLKLHIIKEIDIWSLVTNSGLYLAQVPYNTSLNCTSVLRDNSLNEPY